MTDETTLKPQPSTDDDAPLVFTDGAGGPPLVETPALPGAVAEPGRKSSGRLRQLLAQLVQKRPERPKLGAPSAPVAKKPCPSCKKPIASDLGACPWCAARLDRRPPDKVETERVQGSVLPEVLAKEFAAQRELDGAANDRERRRRLGSRAGITVIGSIAFAVPAAIVWSILASPSVLRPAIVGEAVAAWVLMRVLLATRSGSMPAALAALPVITARIFGVMLCSLDMEKHGHALGALHSGLEGRGAGAAFAMVAGSAVLTLVTATLLKIGIELSDDDYAAPEARPHGVGPILHDLVAALRGALSVDSLEVVPPRQTIDAPEPVAPGDRRLIATSSAVFLALPGMAFWLFVPVGWPWLLLPLAAETAAAGLITWHILAGRGSSVAPLVALARLLVGVAVALAAGQVAVAAIAALLGLLAIKVGSSIAAALEASALGFRPQSSR